MKNINQKLYAHTYYCVNGIVAYLVGFEHGEYGWVRFVTIGCKTLDEVLAYKEAHRTEPKTRTDAQKKLIEKYKYKAQRISFTNKELPNQKIVKIKGQPKREMDNFSEVSNAKYESWVFQRGSYTYEL